MLTDYHTYVGPYPFRHLLHPDPDALVRVLDREGVETAWVGHLPSAFYRDPATGNAALRGSLAAHAKRLRAVATVRPDWPLWRDELLRATESGEPAVRVYPQLCGLASGDGALSELAFACAQRDLALILTVRFEDSRQRHPLDAAGELTAAIIRDLARAGTHARIIVLAAGRSMIEEVHWGLTDDERRCVWWDISWIWGPPEDDLAHLWKTIGTGRLVYGSGWPLRLAQTPRANLALLPDDLSDLRLADVRAR